jgi:hypothetical protein
MEMRNSDVRNSSSSFNDASPRKETIQDVGKIMLMT